jgi:TonB-dependent receptor
VRTDVEATGLLQINNPSGLMDPATCIAANGAAACQPLIQALTFIAGGSEPGYQQTNSYDDVLPSLNLRYHITDELQMRFAAAKAIVRPTFSQMMPYTSLSFTFESDGFTPDDVSPYTGTGGNPLLRPTKSTQFDVSLEWYFAPTGSLTFAGFYKDITDYIFLGQSDETYTSNGVTQTFDVTRNMNGDEGKIQGFELAYQQFYDMLPGGWSGLGVFANYTYVDSSGGRNTAVNILEPAQVTGAEDETLPLEGLSENSYNLGLMYEKFGVSARLAYNWREKFLLTTSAANIQRPVWMEDYGQLDGSVFYSINENIKVGLQVTNLLNSRTFLDVGGATLAPRYSWTDTDRRIALAIRTSF